jgi:sensor histidine kinase YesM
MLVWWCKTFTTPEYVIHVPMWHLSWLFSLWAQRSTNMFNETFKSSSIFLKLSLIPAFVGFLCHLVSFAASYWRVIKSTTFVSPYLNLQPQLQHTYCGLWNCFSCFSDNPNCESAGLELEGKETQWKENKINDLFVMNSEFCYFIIW